MFAIFSKTMYIYNIYNIAAQKQSLYSCAMIFHHSPFAFRDRLMERYFSFYFVVSNVDRIRQMFRYLWIPVIFPLRCFHIIYMILYQGIDNLEFLGAMEFFHSFYFTNGKQGSGVERYCKASPRSLYPVDSTCIFPDCYTRADKAGPRCEYGFLFDSFCLSRGFWDSKFF